MNLYSPEQVQARPYTVKSLADRWECSEEHIRKMVKSGRLRAFAIGDKLIRIAAIEP